MLVLKCSPFPLTHLWLQQLLDGAAYAFHELERFGPSALRFVLKVPLSAGGLEWVLAFEPKGVVARAVEEVYLAGDWHAMGILLLTRSLKAAEEAGLEFRGNPDLLRTYVGAFEHWWSHQAGAHWLQKAIEEIGRTFKWEGSHASWEAYLERLEAMRARFDRLSARLDEVEPSYV